MKSESVTIHVKQQYFTVIPFIKLFPVRLFQRFHRCDNSEQYLPLIVFTVY